MRSLSLALSLLLPTLSRALLVVPSSPQCAAQCGNVLSSTSGAEITCDDADYGSATYGATFQSCLSCELSSTYFDPKTNQSDLQAALYNFRYALAWCLFGFDNNTAISDTPCLTSFSCAPLQVSFETDGLNTSASPYSYCPTYNGISEPKCSACLSETGHNSYLSNFVTILEAACIQEPALGSTLSIQGSPFSTIPVNITTPSPSSLPYDNGFSNGLSLGAKIGISVGAIIFVLVTSGCCIIWNGKRRRRRYLAEKARLSGYEWKPQQGNMSSISGGSGGFFDSPQSQRPFATAWGYPTSPETAQREKFNFSPYQSQHASPSTPIVGPSRAHEWPRDRKPPLSPEEESPEIIEMVVGVGGGGGGGGDAKGWIANPAPLLHHPGDGRSNLTAEDVKSGRAV